MIATHCLSPIAAADDLESDESSPNSSSSTHNRKKKKKKSRVFGDQVAVVDLENVDEFKRTAKIAAAE